MEKNINRLIKRGEAEKREEVKERARAVKGTVSRCSFDVLMSLIVNELTLYLVKAAFFLLLRFF